MSRCLVDTYRLAVQFDHIHYFYGVVGIVLSHELHKPIALMTLGNSILRHVHVHYRASLEEELPENSFQDFFIQAADVHRRIFTRGHSKEIVKQSKSR